MSTQVPGSYTKTSKSISFDQDSSGGGRISAQCQKIDGSWTESGLTYDVANMNGVLTPLPGGDYQRTARKIHLENRNGGVSLVAECQKIDGSWVPSALNSAISNMNGALTPIPSGSYQQTARNVHLENQSDGVYLVAECQKRDGSWVPSKLKLHDIANNDGKLTY